MDSEKIRVPYVGVNMYCIDCGRLLVNFHGDGLMDVAGKTEVRGSAEGYIDDEGYEFPPDALVVTQAICMRRWCKARRWVRENTTRLRRK